MYLIRLEFMATASLAALSLTLSACGEGGANSTPFPPVAPTTSPIVSGRTYDTATVQFDNSTWPYTLSSLGYGKGVTIRYDAAAGTYTFVAPNADSVTFTSADRVSPSHEGASSFLKHFTNGSDGVELRFPKSPVKSGVTLSYVMLASWRHTVLGDSDVYVAVAGEPTSVSDIPKSGSATYSTAVGGTAVVNPGTVNANYNLDEASTSNLSINFGTGAVNTQLTLRGVPIGSPTGTPSTFLIDTTGVGTLTSGGPGYSGTFATAGNGVFSGALFGPSASETAYAFHILTPELDTGGHVWGVQK